MATAGGASPSRNAGVGGETTALDRAGTATSSTIGKNSREGAALGALRVPVGLILDGSGAAAGGTSVVSLSDGDDGSTARVAVASSRPGSGSGARGNAKAESVLAALKEATAIGATAARGAGLPRRPVET